MNTLEGEDILDRLKDLMKQAITEKSHYYVANTAKEAIEEIERLRDELEQALDGILEAERRDD